MAHETKTSIGKESRRHQVEVLHLFRCFTHTHAHTHTCGIASNYPIIQASFNQACQQNGKLAVSHGFSRGRNLQVGKLACCTPLKLFKRNLMPCDPSLVNPQAARANPANNSGNSNSHLDTISLGCGNLEELVGQRRAVNIFFESPCQEQLHVSRLIGPMLPQAPLRLSVPKKHAKSLVDPAVDEKSILAWHGQNLPQ